MTHGAKKKNPKFCEKNFDTMPVMHGEYWRYDFKPSLKMNVKSDLTFCF